jgi:hypothetical protein
MNTEVSWKCGMMLWQNERSAAAKSMRSRQAAIGNGRAWSGIMPSTSRTCCNPGCIASIGSGRKLCILKRYNGQFENTGLSRNHRYDRKKLLRNGLVQASLARASMQMHALFYRRLASQKLSSNRCHCPRCELHGARLKHRASGSRQLLRQVPGR